MKTKSHSTDLIQNHLKFIMDKIIINKIAINLDELYSPTALINRSKWDFIKKAEKHKNYAYLLLRVVIFDRFNLSTRLNAANLLKDVVELNWVNMKKRFLLYRLYNFFHYT